MKNHGMNPYLPSWEYVPDGEPHVFANVSMSTAAMTALPAMLFARTTMFAGQPRWMT